MCLTSYSCFIFRHRACVMAVRIINWGAGEKTCVFINFALYCAQWNPYLFQAYFCRVQTSFHSCSMNKFLRQLLISAVVGYFVGHYIRERYHKHSIICPKKRQIGWVHLFFIFNSSFQSNFCADNCQVQRKRKCDKEHVGRHSEVKRLPSCFRETPGQ